MPTPQEEAVEILTSRDLDFELMLVHLAIFRPDLLVRICGASPSAPENRVKRMLNIENYPAMQDNWEEFWGEIKEGKRKIACIKMYKDYTGFGLKESKDAMDAVWAMLGLNNTVYTTTPQSPWGGNHHGFVQAP